MESNGCQACSSGTFSGPQAVVCSPCAPGSFCPGTACEVCIPCPNGQYFDGEGASACMACPAGTDTPELGSDKLEDCECLRGRYSLQGSGFTLKGNPYPLPPKNCRRSQTLNPNAPRPQKLDPRP